MTMPVLQVIREVQIPLVAVMLLAGSVTKVRQMLRTGSFDPGLGPTALFPLSVRKSASLTLCVVEAGLGFGLIVTAGSTTATGGEAMATIARLGAGLLFLVATSTLIELRTVRPDVGCGCFGDFSTTPVSGRTIARSAFLAVAIMSTIGMQAFKAPHTGTAGLELLAIVCAELVLLGFLSPEVGEGLIRLGYSEPCELRVVPSARTLAALRRSKPWRRYAGLIASDGPSDVWRELCWRYVVYPSSYEGRPADLVFAVFLQSRRPVVHAALVDSGTGMPLPLPTAKGRARFVAPSPGAPSPAAHSSGAPSPGAPSPAAAADPANAANPADAANPATATDTSAAAASTDAATPDATDEAAGTTDPDATLVDLIPHQP
jgi:hypothetical protein